MSLIGMRPQKGFTLPELLVAAAVFGVLAIVAVSLLRPADYGPIRRNGERWAQAAQLAQALSRYAKQNGGLPSGITKEFTLIGNDEEMLDLCPFITPKYLKDLPVEPLARVSQTTCGTRKAGSVLITGFAVRKITDNKFEVLAPLAEKGEDIVVSGKF